MNKFFKLLFFCSTIVLSQVSSPRDLGSPAFKLTYCSNDTVLALPFLSNNFSLFTKNPISEWYNLGASKVDFESYISKEKSVELNLLLENNIISFGLPIRDSYLSFGLNHNIYGNINLSNELLNLFWNGNAQYLDQTISFNDNYSNYIQFSSLYFQYYFDLPKYKIGARLNFLHGINYFNLDEGNFTLNSVSNLITPFSTYISTNIYAETSTAKLIGFSNPGLSLDYAINFNFSKFDFLIQFQNIGFIYWQNNASIHQSNRNYLFNGFDYTMDQVISEEFQNTLDTLSDVFAVSSEKGSSFIRRIPLKISFETSFETNSDFNIFINFQCIEELGEYNNLSFFNLYFIGLSKDVSNKVTLYGSYNYNKFNSTNLSLGLYARFNHFHVGLNTNNLLSLFGDTYFNLNTAVYYLF